MSKISKKILDDLEFPVVIDYLKNHCVSSEGKSAISKLKPFVNKLKAIDELEKVNEVLFSFTTENHLPSLHFDSITKDLDLIQDLIKETGTRSELTEATHNRFKEAARRYGEEAGEMTVCKLLEEDAGIDLRVEGD